MPSRSLIQSDNLFESRSILSLLFPAFWGAASASAALLSAFYGVLAGLSIGWFLVELGKKLFGQKMTVFEEPVPWSVAQPDAELPPVVSFGDDAYGWADIFARPSDCLIVQCPELNVSGRSFKNVRAEMGMETLTVMSSTGNSLEKVGLENVTLLQGTATEMVMPREAIGFGVVLMTAMTGAFLGPTGAVYVLGLSLLLLLIVSYLKTLGGHGRCQPRIEVAPFTLPSCLLFLALRHFGLL